MEILDVLKEKEPEAILSGFAMMSYNPSIGRVLEKGGVDKFIKIMTESISRLENISNQTDFDAFHDSVVEIIKDTLKTNRNAPISYGQAQKPLNVFLKVFIDWANLPSRESALKLKSLLHVPLDSILMTSIKENFPNEYTNHVVTSYDLIRNKLKASFREEGEIVEDSILKKMVNSSNFALEGLRMKETYYAWQNCLRIIYPTKPVLLDIFWSLNRRSND